MKKTFLRAIIFGSVMAASTSLGMAHEMFLKADKYSLAPNSNSILKLYNGTFDNSENSIGRERMKDVSLVHHGKTSHPSNDKWFDSNNISYLNIETGKSGTYVAGVSTHARTNSMSAQDFIDNMKHDGNLDILADFQKNSTLTKVRKRYSKHVRTIFQVGDKRTDDYKKKLGYPVEVLLTDNPYDLTVNDTLGFQVLENGKAVVGQMVSVNFEGYHSHDTSSGHLNAYQLHTDADGRAEFSLNKQGKWYISVIRVKKINEAEADYHADFATVTFEIK